MASLDRAYGIRGVVIALTMATVAGAVHGTLAQAFDILWVKIVIGMAGSIVLVMAGVISARRSWWGTIALGVSMGVLFFVARWSCWAVMAGGPSEAMVFLTTAPLVLPQYLAAAGIRIFWIVEAVSMCVPAMFGCVAGHERGAAP